ncbi:Fur family transcriptional regulator [Dethiothermospora halolimnae]|uniref:Fur family transcriptional regulator n=1 Tax=Dethiothermospora halolimnae TaxID=3114390 RepID=UPI003CCC0478
MSKFIEQLKTKLKEKGYKLTTQRRIILDVILENKGDHLSPEEIYERVKDKFPEIGLATVYRTLQLFEELDIIYKLNFNDGCSRYELNSDSKDHRHHHLICLSCGKVIEVQLDLLESLEETIEKDGKFKIIDHNVKFFGYCEKCK